MDRITGLSGWIWENSTVPWDKADRFNVKIIYFDLRSDNAVQVRDDIFNHGRLPGGYSAAAWHPEMSGYQFADWTSEQLNKLLPKLTSEAPPCMLDLEAVSMQWQRDCLNRYRSHQPARPTNYTNEPFKDGTVVPIPLLNKWDIHWYPQLYYGIKDANDEYVQADSAAVINEIARWNYPPNKIHPFYDAHFLPGDHRDGCVFTLERLP